WARSLMRNIVVRRKRGKKRESNKTLLVDRSISGDAQRSIRFAATNGFKAELDRARAGSTCGRQRDRRTLRTELVGQVMPHGAENETVMIMAEFSGARGAN